MDSWVMLTLDFELGILKASCLSFSYSILIENGWIYALLSKEYLSISISTLYWKEMNNLPVLKLDKQTLK